MKTLSDYEYYRTKLGVIYKGDCLDILPLLKKNSVDLVLTDPPYFNIKTNEWDNQWKSFDDFLDFIENISLKSKKLLKNNGSFYIFGDDKNIAYIQVRLDKHFELLNNLVWYKKNNISIKGAHTFRSYTPVSERILFYANKNELYKDDKTGLKSVMLNIDNFSNLRQYFYKILCFIGKNNKQIGKDLGHRKAEHCFYVVPKKEIIEKIGGKADHCFRYGSTQWDLPTKETYHQLIKVYNINKMEGFIKYESLRLEYESLRLEYESLRRTFNFPKDIYEVIDIPIISGKENTAHPTTKPLRLIKIFIKASSNSNDLILDPFAGSGTTGIACELSNRRYILIEKEESYCKIIVERIRKETSQTTLSDFF